jgi:hypothetical protein
LSSDEKVKLLGAYSIARYSFVLWTNEYGQKAESVAKRSKARRILKPISIIVGDVGGFIAGGPLGDPMGVADWASDTVNDIWGQD